MLQVLFTLIYFCYVECVGHFNIGDLAVWLGILLGGCKLNEDRERSYSVFGRQVSIACAGIDRFNNFQ